MLSRSTKSSTTWSSFTTEVRRRRTVADVALVLLTVGLFVVLALVVRAVERL
jgi:hypothetical protein